MTETGPSPQPFACLWTIQPDTPCLKTFTDADKLNEHLSLEHVGHKKDGTLNLRCSWISCPMKEREFAKRALLFNHIKSHIAHKAFRCDSCDSEFKWFGSLSHDLKKHQKKHHQLSTSSMSPAPQGSSSSEDVPVPAPIPPDYTKSQVEVVEQPTNGSIPLRNLVDSRESSPIIGATPSSLFSAPIPTTTPSSSSVLSTTSNHANYRESHGLQFLLPLSTITANQNQPFAPPPVDEEERLFTESMAAKLGPQQFQRYLSFKHHQKIEESLFLERLLRERRERELANASLPPPSL
ncbi:hypothetical protein BCR33DRAFT_793107 [Rhizoclosmatium globosum]|uniref:C2H2-type domain-containing protein n=1 Tax=Rhizoclosmatium globosum TaxID=329046 RepID=A0A1Y2B404_9FUNG|nr:hypothetical protein BCR33DRAFT_793107 [Rhizoclosmatium globosum]|eukprot:ORY29280.1 hypothetical protein BCR33DRAFT_793107 [Rhizoclosmatium globosum]